MARNNTKQNELAMSDEDDDDDDDEEEQEEDDSDGSEDERWTQRCRLWQAPNEKNGIWGKR